MSIPPCLCRIGLLFQFLFRHAKYSQTEKKKITVYNRCNPDLKVMEIFMKTNLYVVLPDNLSVYVSP